MFCVIIARTQLSSRELKRILRAGTLEGEFKLILNARGRPPMSLVDMKYEF